MDKTRILSELSQLVPKVVRTPVVYLRMREPALLRFYFQVKHVPVGNSIEGSSPPDIFVGREGYPKVFVGPLIPKAKGNTEILSSPEKWVGKGIQEIVEMRSQLVRGMQEVKVTDFESTVYKLQEMSLSKKPVDSEAEFLKKPKLNIRWDDHVQPFGPSARLKSFRITENGDTDFEIEKAYYDFDLKAGEAIKQLYEKGVLVSKIQRCLSAGMFGISKKRKLVPTRWSITAVDDLLGKSLLEKVKSYPPINEHRVYEINGLDNQWLVLMLPQKWSYELVEAWWPGTVWNQDGKYIAMYSSSEWFFGRKEYAEIGGCYYAARLATAEFLEKEKRQATVIILRESRPGYIMPVGVWNVREHVRAALASKPFLFNSLNEALKHIDGKMKIPLKEWIRGSELLQRELKQKKLTDYFSL